MAAGGVSSQSTGVREAMDIGVVMIRTPQLGLHGEQACLEAVKRGLLSLGVTVREQVIVRPDPETIAENIALLADRLHLPLVLTVGGTGLHPDDVAPDGAKLVIHRPAPGIAEAMRAHVIASNPEFMLTRGVAGLRGRTLVINLPDSPRDLESCLGLLSTVLPGALKRIRGSRDEAQLRLL